MIDFELSEKDREVLGKLREEAIVTRRYARYYDENEHEFPPDRGLTAEEQALAPGTQDHPSRSVVSRTADRGTRCPPPPDTSIGRPTTITMRWGRGTLSLPGRIARSEPPMPTGTIGTPARDAM